MFQVIVQSAKIVCRCPPDKQADQAIAINIVKDLRVPFLPSPDGFCGLKELIQVCFFSQFFGNTVNEIYSFHNQAFPIVIEAPG